MAGSIINTNRQSPLLEDSRDEVSFYHLQKKLTPNIGEIFNENKLEDDKEVK